MDKTTQEMRELLEWWRATGIKSMRIHFSRWISAGHRKDVLISSPVTQKYFNLLRRTREILKKTGQMNKKSTISFRRDMIDLIIAGRKTVTIRPVKDGDVSGNSITYRYGLPGEIVRIREQPSIELKINAVVNLIRLHNISPWTWQDDGITTDDINDVIDHWDSFYGETNCRWKNNPLVWVIWFEVTEGKED